MKPLLIGVALLCCGFARANQDPKMIRVCVQLIEVSHPVLTELLGSPEKSGPAQHAKAIALSKEGKAMLLETAMVVSRSGGKATIESVREWIYPTEYNPTCVGLFGPPPVVPQPLTPPLRPFTSTAFETRNAGVTLEVEPTLGENEQLIDLRFVPEWVRLDRFDTVMEHHDEWGDASLRMPVFEIWRANTSLTLMAGKFELASVITPKAQPPVPTVSRRLLLFVRADVVPALHSP